MRHWRKSLAKTWRIFFDPNYALMAALEEIRVMKKLGFRDYQDVEEFLIGWSIGETRLVAGCPTTLIEDNKTYCQFKTIIPASASFNRHWHDKVEDCYIERGELKDNETGIFYRAGQTARFAAFQKHIPANPSSKKDCYLRVTFWKIEAPKLKT